MPDLPFNTASISPVQLLGIDGFFPVSTSNPIPVDIVDAGINVTAVISGAISLANSTASIGRVSYSATAPTLSSAAINTTINGNTTAAIIAAVGTTSINIYRLALTNTTAAALTFQNGTVALTGPMNLAANGSIILDFDGEPWFPLSSGAAFNISSNATSQVSGIVYFRQA